MEVVNDHHRVGSEDLVQQFLQLLPGLDVLELDIASAEIAGRINADLRRAGQPIGWADPLIAVIALRPDLTLVTGNTADYPRIQTLGYGVRLDNWRGPCIDLLARVA